MPDRRKTPDEEELDQFRRDEAVRKAVEAEREANDERYAIKLVERVVFGVLAAGGLTILGFALNALFHHYTP